MKCLFPFLLYCGLFAFFSCTSRSDELKSKITLMKSTSICLQTAQMNRILPKGFEIVSKPFIGVVVPFVSFYAIRFLRLDFFIDVKNLFA